MEMNFWTYHTKGDPECEACAEPPTSCLSCDGLIHTQFKTDLEEVQDMCDGCTSTLEFAVYHEELK